MRLRHLVAIGFTCAMLAPGPALAQLRGSVSCDGTPAAIKAGSPGAMACARALLNREILINDADVLQRVVGASFGLGPDEVVPAGLAGLTADTASERLALDGPLIIDPAASQAVAASPQWNAWADGKYTWNDSTPANYNLDGGLVNTIIGLDYKLTSKVTVGLMGSFEGSKLVGTAVSTRSEGVGGGPYVGIVLNDNLVFTANVLATSLDENQSGVLHFDATRLQGATALTGYYFKGLWRFSPALSLSWSKEWQNETANLVPDQTIETALLTPSFQVGRTYRLSETATVEPWAGAALDWTFVNRITQGGASPLDNPSVDLRLQGGLNFALGPRAQLALTAEAGGLIEKTFDNYSGEANFAVQF
jgi:hypothetical protein